MRHFGMSFYSVLFAHLSLAAVLFFAGLSAGVETSENLFNDGSASSSSSIHASSRSKRAPGWGKRADSILDEGLYDSDSIAALKRAPGWGKRFSDASLSVKRAPGWGKRFAGMDETGLQEEKRAPGWGKRAPGWGKRSFKQGFLTASEWCKRLDQTVDILLAQTIEADTKRIAECGRQRPSNEFQRK